jgi:hypothetical protein
MLGEIQNLIPIPLRLIQEMFQGSEPINARTSSFTDSKRNKLRRLCPGNWEVIYYKDKCRSCLRLKSSKSLEAYVPRFRWRKTGVDFQPYHIVSKLGVDFRLYWLPVPKRQPPVLSKGITYTLPDENIKYCCQCTERTRAMWLCYYSVAP